MTITAQTPTSPAGIHPSRIVPAVVSGARIFIECPAWCTVDHVDSAENHIADVWHGGDYANLNVPRLGKSPDLLAFARLGVDPMSSDPAKQTAFVFVDDGGEGYEMSPDQAVDFADNLERFAAEIRAMAATANGEVA
ncbi:hypothetical protein HW130_03135 [Streptomyces sp. PKU-EA00015]|uniref:DUF6907 domain-containing protein n=1 Tax=Streptomyces sp. PKU-EA00015 TaxID=2748326 RepID=UPI0015A42DBE|nr:hypothetical protein [Streptomyces sp. PKU-EA00015]NWF25266.1 hypothetical protein [Streptomyces sp. PKU-EA00015]